MKKTIICGIAATLCASALSSQAFATDITEDTSIFAENPEELVATIKGWPEDNTFIDPKTIMPLYEADINDYISTGKLKISDADIDGTRLYISDLIDSNGDFLGVAFSIDRNDGNPHTNQFFAEYGGLPSSSEKHKQCSSVDFRLYSEKIKSLLLANNINPDVKEVKLLDIDGFCTGYYINNGTDEVLVRPGGLEIITNFPDDSDIIVLNEEFRQKAARIVEEERKAYEDFKDKYGEGAGGAGGAGGTDSKNDVPNTGSDTKKHTAALAVELGLVSAMIIGGAVVSKKRKNDR